VQEPLSAIDEQTFVRMVRYALATGIDTIHLRPGKRPLMDGLGGSREINYRQWTGEDSRELLSIFLDNAHVPERLQTSSGEAAQALWLCYELPGQALIEPHLDSAPGGTALRLDVIRPMPRPHDVDVLEL
jgi:hypothetical protein